MRAEVSPGRAANANHRMVWYGMVWYGIVGVVSCRVVWCGVVSSLLCG